MSRITELCEKAKSDKALAAKLNEVFRGKDILEVTDDDIIKFCEIARNAGSDISLAEVKEFLDQNEKELDEDELDAVSGGFFFFFF